MSKIRILPEQLANRIAAGEVVERPASVVKELLENSLDAGASDIEIEIEGSGTRLIRVMDNGEGMDEDDLLLCLERHGTSKLTSNHDLAAINSLGFRGEAIPSIGSVSRMTITSRTPESSLGAKVTLDYGKLIKVHEIGCSRGTIFEIRNLFGNTPARRKFLRTSRTELAHIEEVVKCYALAAPAVSFILRVDDRVVYHFTKSQPLRDRLAQIMHYQGAFLEVGKAPDNNSLQTCGHVISFNHAPAVHGWLLPPDIETARSAQLRLLVNGRAVRDRTIIHAIAEGFRNFLMKGKSPAGLIHLRLPPEDVDVNVHPTKQEIRLRDSQGIHQMISQTVEQAIHAYQKKIQGVIFRTPTPDNKPEKRATALLPVSGIASPQATRPPFQTTLCSPPASVSCRKEISQREHIIQHQTGNSQSAPQPPAFPQTAEPIVPETSSPLHSIPLTQQPPAATRDHGHGLKVIGQFDNLYIFCQSADGGLVVVDQHAAHERLLFEDLKKKFLQGCIASQSLLFPVTVELTIAESECVEHHAADIQQMGFTVGNFGGNSYVISAVPALAGQCSPVELFRDMLGRFVAENSTKEKTRKGSILDDILAAIACKAAVKAGDQLHAKEIDALLTRMSRANLFSHCPHGRPVTKHFTTTEIKKWFYRP